MRHAALLFALAALGCTSTQRRCDAGLPLLHATLWVQASAEYRAAALQTYTAARRALDDALAQPSSLPAAVILDLDETALDNSRFAARQLAKGKTFTFGDEWTAWVNETASEAVPGAVEFLRYAESRGVTPFYITSRLAKHEAATRAMLEKLGFPLSTTEDTLLVRGERPEWSASSKAPRRDSVKERYRVLLYLGDAGSDFPNDRPADAAPWGTEWFLIPNPIYGSWEDAGEEWGPPCEQVRHRIEALRK